MYTKEQLCNDLNIPNIPPPTDLLDYDCYSLGGHVADQLRFIKKHYPSDKTLLIAEIGVWVGFTALEMAEQFDCFVFAVDWFQGSDRLKRKTWNSPPWARALPIMKEQCLSNIVHRGLWDKVIVIPETSMEAVKYFPDHFFDVVSIDACHETQAVYDDVTHWGPKVKQGQYLIGDDIQLEMVRKGLTMADMEPDGSFHYFWWKQV